MKTVVQELKEYFEQQLRLQISSKIKYTAEEALLDAIQVCENAFYIAAHICIVGYFIVKLLEEKS